MGADGKGPYGKPSEGSRAKGEASGEQQTVKAALSTQSGAPAFNASLRKAARDIVAVHGGETTLIKMIHQMARGEEPDAAAVRTMKKVSGYLRSDIEKMEAASEKFRSRNTK